MEIEEEKTIDNQSNQTNNELSSVNSSDTEKIKLDLLNDQIKILNETNQEFIEENQSLKSQSNDLNIKIFELQKELIIKDEQIKQNILDKKELDFLRLNLIYSSKCQRSTFRKGFKVGTPEYRKCILSGGKHIND